MSISERRSALARKVARGRVAFELFSAMAQNDVESDTISLSVAISAYEKGEWEPTARIIMWGPLSMPSSLPASALKIEDLRRICSNDSSE